MTQAPLARLLAETRLPPLGDRPTVARARDAVAQIFTSLRDAGERDGVPAPPGDTADGAQDDAVLRARVLDLLRSAVVGTLQAVRPGPVPDAYRHPYRDRAPSLRERLLGSEPAPPPPPPPPAPIVVPHLLFQHLGFAMGSADELLELARPVEPAPEPEPAFRPWVKDKELVDLFHQLLEAAAARDGEHLLRLVDLLRKDLTTLHEIDVVDFDETTARHFTVAEGPAEAGAAPVTVRPALLHRDVLLRRGRAVVPGMPQPGPIATDEEVLPDGEGS